MNIIESLVDKVKNLNKETLLDIAISVIVIALFFMISNLISYVIIRLFSLKEKDKQKKPIDPRKGEKRKKSPFAASRSPKTQKKYEKSLYKTRKKTYTSSENPRI